MKEISREWLKAAVDDLGTITEIIDNEQLTNIVAFHAQQAVEKSLKAIIEEFDLEMSKIHNLQRLFEIVKDHLSLSIDPIIVESLDRLYIDARYPGELGLLPHGKPALKDAEKFYNFAKTFYEAVYRLLEKKK